MGPEQVASDGLIDWTFHGNWTPAIGTSLPDLSSLNEAEAARTLFLAHSGLGRSNGSFNSIEKVTDEQGAFYMAKEG